MNVEVMSLAEVRTIGLQALSQALGPVGMVRFLQQYETGMGDYTSERYQWLGETTVRQVVQELAEHHRLGEDRQDPPPNAG